MIKNNFTMVKKEFEVYSYEEAVAAAETEGYKVIRNKTNSWKNAGSPIGDAALKTFANTQMEKEKLVGVPGVGFIVVVANGSKDTRERPYTYENVVTDGRMATERTYEVRRVDNGDLVVALAGDGATKDAAIKAAKEVMCDVKTDLKLEVVYRVKDGKSTVGYLKYTPSINAQKGRYIFFGNEVAGF
jgi:hypothetical protein